MDSVISLVTFCSIHVVETTLDPPQTLIMGLSIYRIYTMESVIYSQTIGPIMEDITWNSNVVLS